MSETTFQRPVVYETQVSSAEEFRDRIMRGGLPPAELLLNAQARRDRIQQVLGESGIDLISTHEPPSDLGFEQKKFIVLGRKTSPGELMEQAHEAAPGLDTSRKTPLKESLDREIALPFVLKRPLRDSGGVNKFLINRPDQVETLRSFCEERKYAIDDWFTEPYIETPGGVNSSYRLVVTATGVVVASTLLYKPRIAGEKAEAPFITEHVDPGGPFRPYTKRENEDGWVDFADRESEWFLDADAIASNVASGGNIIPLKIRGELGNDRLLTEQERNLLQAHDLSNLETPEQLLVAAESLGKGVGPHVALLLGIDIIQDKRGRYHLLEINAYPGIDSILLWWGLDPAKVRGDEARQDRVSDDLLRVVGDSLSRLGDE